MAYHRHITGASCTGPSAALAALAHPLRATRQPSLSHVRQARLHAVAWAVDPTKIAIAGFSAGGHLAGHVALGWDLPVAQDVDAALRRAGDEAAALSARPSAAVLSYAVVSASSEAVGPLSALLQPFGIRNCLTYSCVGAPAPEEGRPVRHHGSFEVLLCWNGVGWCGMR